MTRARNSANLASQGNLFVDIANDRTGIGSVAPAQNLHVAGTAGFHGDTTFVGDSHNITWDRSHNRFKFDADAELRFQDSSFRIYNDGSGTSFIKNTSTNLRITSNIFRVRKANDSTHYINCASDAVALYESGTKKFETTAYGIDVTGTTDTDGLIVSGVATVTTMNVTGVLTYDDVTSVDSVGIITARQGIFIDDSITHIGDTNTKIRFPAADTITAETGGSERLRITSDGQTIVNGTTNLGHPNMDDIVVGDASGNRGITIASGSGTNFGSVAFGDSTDGSGADRYEGLIEYYHGDDSLSFYTAHTNKLKITSGGHVVPGADSSYDIGLTGTRFRNVYADTYYGDGSNLTNITQTTINNNANNRLITGSGTANTLEGESTLTYDGNQLNVVQTTSSSDSKVVVANSNTPGSGSLRLEFQYGTGTTEGTNRFRFGYVEGYRAGGSNDGGLKFGTKPNNAGAPTERLRIDSSGRLLLGTTTEGEGNADDLTIATSGHTGITIRAGTTSQSAIYMSDATSGGGEYVGNIIYDHNDNHMRFATNENERLRITSSGTVLHGTGAVATQKATNGGLDVACNGHSIVFGADSNSGNPSQARTNNATKDMRISAVHYTNAEEPIGIVRVTSDSTTNVLNFGGGSSILNAATTIGFYTAANKTTTNGTERLRIDSAGNMSLGKSAAASTNYGANFQIHDTGTSGAALHLTNSNTGSSNSDGFHLVQQGSHIYFWNRESGDQVFAVSGNERLRITSSALIVNGDNGIYVRPVTSAVGAKIKFSDTVNESYGQEGTFLYKHLDSSIVSAAQNDSLSTNEGFYLFGNQTQTVFRIDAGTHIYNDYGLWIKTTTQGGVSGTEGTRLRFSSNPSSNYDQIGEINYQHTDNGVTTGFVDGFVISGSDGQAQQQYGAQRTIVKVNGSIQATGNVWGEGSVVQTVRGSDVVQNNTNPPESMGEIASAFRTTLTVKTVNPYIKVTFYANPELDSASNRTAVRFYYNKNSGSYNPFGRPVWMGSFSDSGNLQGDGSMVGTYEQLTCNRGDTLIFSPYWSEEGNSNAQYMFGQTWANYGNVPMAAFMLIEEIAS